MIDQLYEAMELIEEAQALVDEVANEAMQTVHYEAYGKYGFDQLLGNGNPYDMSIPKMIEELEEN